MSKKPIRYVYYPDRGTYEIPAAVLAQMLATVAENAKQEKKKT